MKARRVILIAAAVILLMLAWLGISYLRSPAFKEKIMAALVQRIEQATGLQVKLGRFSLNVFRGRFAVDALELRSLKESGSRLELDVGEITGSLRLTSLWRPKIDLTELNLIRPRMRILPAPGGGPTRLGAIMRKSLDVAAGKATIQDGWVEWNNRRIPLNLVMDALNCSIAYQPDPQSYAVQISYRNSPLQWGERRFVYDLDASVNLLATGLEINSFALREGRSRFAGGGALNDWDAPALQISTSGTFSRDEYSILTPALKEAHGDIAVNCDLGWDARGFHASGKFRTDAAYYRQTVGRALRGSFEIQDNRLFLRDVDGRLGGGSFQVAGVVPLTRADPEFNHFQISANNVPLRDAASVLELKALSLDNSVDASVTLDWRRGAADLSAEGSVGLRGMPADVSDSGVKTALGGPIEFWYRNRAWHLKKINLSSPDTRIDGQEEDPERSHILLDTDRPAEVLSLLRNFAASLEGLITDYPDLLALSGRFHLDGDIVIRPTAAMSYEGQLTVTNARWRIYSITSLGATASWDGSRLRLRALKLQRGTQSAEGEFVFDVPRGEAPPDVSFDGSIHEFSLASLRDLGVDPGAEIAGPLSGRGRLSYQGGFLEGNGRLQVEKGSVNGQSFDLLTATATLKDHALTITDGLVNRGSASVSAQGKVNLDTREINLSARLKQLPFADIPEVHASGLALQGRATASGEIHGRLDRLEVKANVDLEGLGYSGWDLGQGKATVTLREGALSATFDVQSGLGGFRGSANVSTDSGYQGRAELEFRDWNVHKIIADNAPSIFNDLNTLLHGNLVIEGPFAEPSKLKYRGSMDGARFEVHGYELHNEGLMKFALANQKLSVEEARLAGDGSSLSLGGDIPIGTGAGLDLHLNGKLNLICLDRLVPKLGVSGSAALNVSATGSWKAPEVIGRAALEDARVEHEDLPYPLAGLRGNLIFSRNSVRLEGVTGVIASGTMRLDGTVEHQINELRGVSLQATVRKARLHYPKDFVSSIDAELNLRGGPDALVLTGDVTVLRADYSRDFSMLEQLIGRPSGGSGPQVADSLLAGTRLNVTVRSENGLYIDNELARVQAGISLTLRGTLAYPSVTGRVEATEGSIFFRGNRFDIVHGSADFVDRSRINPVFDVRAEADVRSYRLSLDVNGDLDHLRLNVTSDPPLSTVDIVSLMTTGKSGDIGSTGIENPRRQAEMTGLSAASILSESLTGVIGKRVERIFGLQSFRVDPFLAGAENDPTARVTISERLSNDLTITFSRNLTTTKEQIVVLEYDVTKNLTIVATRDEDGTYGVDFRFRKRFR